jgi:hypothetical protein
VRKVSSVRVSAAFALVVALAIPAFSQAVKGDSELGLNGAVIITHQSPISTSGLAAVTYGYYFTNRDQLGFQNISIISGGGGSGTSVTDYFLGDYIHLFPLGSNPKVAPFVGGAAGVLAMTSGGSSSATGGGSNSGTFIANGQGGLKFYVSEKTAFEVAYQLLYEQQSGGTFASNSLSEITFGFTYSFGGPRKKH